MANINLLPWREWERERKQKEFLTQLGVVFVIGVLLVFGAALGIGAAVDEEPRSNSAPERTTAGTSSDTSRDFPIPASPWTRIAHPFPPSARRHACSRISSSSRRPTKDELDDTTVQSLSPPRLPRSS